jgi:hypothetical protein
MVWRGPPDAGEQCTMSGALDAGSYEQEVSSVWHHRQTMMMGG